MINSINSIFPHYLVYFYCPYYQTTAKQKFTVNVVLNAIIWMREEEAFDNSYYIGAVNYNNKLVLLCKFFLRSADAH